MATLTSLLGSFQPSPGRNHLIAFTLGLLITFLGIRANTRLIRANVRWWFHDLKPGGLHIHHMVIGVVVMVMAGVVMIATDPHGFWGIATALAFGGGVALTLDEFALLLHLENVYWQEQGRISVDAVIVTITVALLFLGGLQPFNAVDATPLAQLGGWVITVLVIVNVTLAIICFLKGKLWTGVLGCFVPVVATVGALRLARPGSPWFQALPRQPRQARTRRAPRLPRGGHGTRLAGVVLRSHRGQAAHTAGAARARDPRPPGPGLGASAGEACAQAVRAHRRCAQATTGRAPQRGASANGARPRPSARRGRDDRLEIEQKASLRRHDLLVGFV